jgi:cardiolipin synthase
VNLPNAISLARLFSAPFVVWLILSNETTVAFWIFLIAAVSDAVDGFIAKRLGTETVLGGYLDPIADKVLLVGTYAALGSNGMLALWLVILVVFRDLLIVGGALLFRLLTRTLDMEPLMVSKVNTVAQIVLAAVVLGNSGLGLGLTMLIDVLVVVIAATTLTSGAAYVAQWARRAGGVEPAE